MQQGRGNEVWRELAFLGHIFSLVKIGVVLKHQVLQEEPKLLGYSEGGDKERHGQNRVTGVTRQRSERKETAAGGGRGAAPSRREMLGPRCWDPQAGGLPAGQ